jgi:hypothetical protein
MTPHVLASLTYLLHPYSGDGYQFWSGIGSDVGEVTLLGALLALYRAHCCTHCHRIGLHPLAVHTPATTIADGSVTTRQAVTHTYRSCRKHLDHDHAERARAQRSRRRLLARLRLRAVNRRH